MISLQPLPRGRMIATLPSKPSSLSNYYVHTIRRIKHLLNEPPQQKKQHFSTSNATKNTIVSPLLPSQVKIVEVSPRDGLQNELKFVSTNDKIKLIHLLHSAGCKYIEPTSFVSPKWIPQMKDADEVMEGVRHLSEENDDVVMSCLTPNVKGLERAIESGANEVAIFGSASESFSQKNINCSISESLSNFELVVDKARNEYGVPVRGYVSCTLGCPYQGKVDLKNVVNVVERMWDMGCREISLGDTVGVGTPRKTVEMLKSVMTVVPKENLAVHFHDTYGQALSNIYASLCEGIPIIDCSVGGLGGCPYAIGASGNVATEDVLYML